MKSGLSHSTHALDHGKMPLPAVSGVHTKGELGEILSQGGNSDRALGSAHVQSTVPGVPVSPQTQFTFHSDTHTSDHPESHTVHQPVADEHHTHAETHHVAHDQPKQGFFSRMKNTVKGWFAKKKDKEISHPPLVGSEKVQVGNKSFEVRQGKWYNKIFSNTIGRLTGILTHTLLMFRPQDGLKNPDMGKIKDILSRYNDINWDTDHTIYLGHSDRWDQVKKMFQRRKGFMNTIQNILLTPIVVGESIGANLSRADHYNPLTKSLSIYSPNKWVAAHEMGHAADFSQKRDIRELEKRAIPILGTLYTEKVASTNAISRTRNAEEKKEAEKVLYPAFGSYVGGGIGAAIGGVLSYLGFKQGSRKAQELLAKLSKVFLPVLPLAGIALGHINARLPKSLQFKLFDKKNEPTSGDITSTPHQAHGPVNIVPDPAIADLQAKVAQQEEVNKELTEKLIQVSEGLHQETVAHEHTKKAHEDTIKEAAVAKKHEEHPKEEKREKDTDHEKIDAMKKDADIVRAKLTKNLPKDYEISREELDKGYKGMQKLTAVHKDKEKKHDPEIIITVYEPGKVKVRYNPQHDHGSVKDLNYSYYLGEMGIDALDKCLPAIANVVSPADGKKPDFHALEAAGLKKEGEDGDKHGHPHKEGPFGLHDQNHEHHKKEKEKQEKGSNNTEEKKKEEHPH